MYQVSNYLFDIDIQTVVYINIFLEIIILHTHFIIMHARLFTVLILILAFCISIYLCKAISELNFNVLLLQHLIHHQFKMTRVMKIKFLQHFHIFVFMVVVTFIFKLFVIFNDNKNKFNEILYLVTIATTIPFDGLFITLYVLIIVVIFSLIINENDIVVYHYVYHLRYQFKVIFCNNSGSVWNYSLSLDKIVFLQQIIA